jgi:hypothetical protein
MSDQARDAGLSALESKLTSLTPQPSALDRDYVLYHAGRASVRPGWFWQAATGFLVVVVACLSLALLYRPIQRSDPLVVQDVPPIPPQPVPPTPSTLIPSPRVTEADPTYRVAQAERERSQAENLRQRDQVLRFGIESLPQSRPSAAAEGSVPLDPLVGLPASSLDDDSSRLLLRSTLHSGN